MSPSLIERVVSGDIKDSEDGAPLAVGTRSVVIADSLQGSEADVVAPLDLGRQLAVIDDVVTRDVLGARVARALGGQASVQHITLPGRPHADAVTAEDLRRETERCDALIAVGSGTINDLCKYVAAGDDKPYAVFATAPSMNGYVAANAAITVEGHKKSLAASPPAGAFFDLAVLAAAPPRMIRSGLGDSLCRPTAQADWLLSHLLLDRPYSPIPFQLLEEDETPLLSGADALMRGDIAAMWHLVNTLVLAGFGMTACGTSAPGSQGEHLISHYADMSDQGTNGATFHGEQIGVTTLTMIRLQELCLAGDAPVLHATAPDEDAVVRHFGADLGRDCWREFRPKRLAGPLLDALNQRLARDWPKIREEIAAVLRPHAELCRALAQAGAPRAAGDLGWSDGFYRRAVMHARLIRNRFTFLDLADDSGGLTGSLDRIL